MSNAKEDDLLELLYLCYYIKIFCWDFVGVVFHPLLIKPKAKIEKPEWHNSRTKQRRSFILMP